MRPDMGRPKESFPDLPRNMTAQRGRDKLYYYHQAGGKKTPLGSDLGEALKQWANLEAGSIGSSFQAVGDAYLKHLEKILERTSYTHYKHALDVLGKVFDKFTLEQIEPRHVKAYIRQRSKKGAAIFEKKVLSALFNWAREEGHTRAPNPCHGMKFSQAERKVIGKLGRRQRYVTDVEFVAVHATAGPYLQDAMDIALLTGQRPSDVLKMTRQDIKEGVLWIVQQKTGVKVGIKVQGEFKRVVERAVARPRQIQSIYIVADAKGQRLSRNQLQGQFTAARIAAGTDYWQFRDIRAKAATDSSDLKKAQQLLGHATETTTNGYRRQAELVVAPLR